MTEPEDHSLKDIYSRDTHIDNDDEEIDGIVIKPRETGIKLTVEKSIDEGKLAECIICYKVARNYLQIDSDSLARYLVERKGEFLI